MKTATLVILAACSMLYGAQARSENSTANEKKTADVKRVKNAKPAATIQNAATDPGYKIGPQDILKIDVWREDQLTRTVPVRPDGKITLPLLNDVQAAGLTPMELAASIHDELKNYVNNPQVTVSVSEINSRRIYVTGEVTHVGAFPLLPGMTVLQALSSSGGFTQFARVRSIYVLRVVNGQKVKLPFNYKATINNKNPEEDIELQPGDVIIVP
jgi:polysaccharide export outer membrane protein